MKLPVQVLTAALLLAGCAAPFNPLEDYEQVNPATDLPSPAARSDADFAPEVVARGQYLVALPTERWSARPIPHSCWPVPILASPGAILWRNPTPALSMPPT